ncbi:glycosyltransferase family 2 protein [Pelagibius sp.]|uniref:glycosyltransferase family 2 protein n=1 Tax=Pelagibius sp. TaxID=1931238 RepID=UPI003B503214
MALVDRHPRSPEAGQAPVASDATSTTGKILSLLVPVLNEEHSITPFLERAEPALRDALRCLGPDAGYEIVFVDDGSTDQTVERILQSAKGRPQIKLVRLSRNFGKEAALTAGLQFVSGHAVVPIDVDLQDPPEVIGDMVEAWMAGAEVVNAVRNSRASDGWFKRWSAGTFYRLYNKIAAHQIPGNVGDFRLLDRKVVDVLNDLTERNRFMKGMFSWVGFEQATVGYERAPRAAGTTKWKYWGLWNFALDGFTASTTAPLRIWSYVGLVVAVLAMAYAAWIVGRTLVFGIEVPGYASLMTLILVLGALNLISIGILGEYIGRIAIEVRQRPLYVVRETFGIAGSGDTSPQKNDGASSFVDSSEPRL